SEWKHLATFSTLAGGKLLSGCYSFVEDFRRNRISATQPRRARFGNGWVRGRDGKWAALTEARFSADSNPVTNINAGAVGRDFYLATGGATTNTSAKLGEQIRRDSSGREPPGGLPLP